MPDNKLYTLPDLTYSYGGLAPFISEEQLQIHHQKHHQAYVNGANDLLQKIENARKEGTDLEMKSVLKNLSFNVGGHILHNLFWKNIAPAGNGGGGEPDDHLGKVLKEEFGTIKRFKKEFYQTALSTEGSGWGALVYCRMTRRPLLMQIEKHNVNIYPSFGILLVLDVWEHAYYLDYKNERAKFVEAFWNIVNWDEIGRRLKSLHADKFQ